MFIPKSFQPSQQSSIIEMVQQYPLATIITIIDDVPVASHVPVRPIPVWTSSTIMSAPVSSQRSLIALKYSAGLCGENTVKKFSFLSDSNYAEIEKVIYG